MRRSDPLNRDDWLADSQGQLRPRYAGRDADLDFMLTLYPQYEPELRAFDQTGQAWTPENMQEIPHLALARLQADPAAAVLESSLSARWGDKSIEITDVKPNTIVWLVAIIVAGILGYAYIAHM